MSGDFLSSWSRERTHLLTEEHKVRLALVACLALYLAHNSASIVRPAPVAAAFVLMSAAAIVFVLGIRTHRLAAAIAFETAATVLTVMDLLSITMLIAGTGGAASGFYLLYALPLIFAAAFFRGVELAFLSGLACLFYGLAFAISPEAHWPTLALRLTGLVLIVWQAYALTGVLHREKQGNDHLLRHLAEGVIVLDDQARVVLVNGAFASMFGVSPSALEGVPAATVMGDDVVLQWVLRDCHDPDSVVPRTTRTGQFPEQDLPLLEVTTISCREYATHTGGWVIVCRDLRDVADCAAREIEESCDGVSPLANLRALSQTLYTMAERLDDSERWRAVSMIEQHTVAMQAIITRLLGQGDGESECAPDTDTVNVSGLLNSTRRILEVRYQEAQVSFEVDCADQLPEVRAGRGPLGRTVLRIARSLLHFARPLDRLVFTSRPEEHRLTIAAELCPPPHDVLASPALERVHHNVESQLRQDMEGLSRLLVQCNAVWTLRRVAGDYFRIEISLPLCASDAAEPAVAPRGFERPVMPACIEYLGEATVNRLNNILGIIRGRAEFALMWPQQSSVESALIAAIERSDEASEVLEMVTDDDTELARLRSPHDGATCSTAACLEPLRAGALPVLIVDDEQGVRELLSAMFASCGCETAEAADAQQAIDYLEEHKPGLVIVDLYMPGARGTEVLRRARQIYPDVPVAMMSGGGNGHVTEALSEYRPDAILSKPFGLSEVIDLVRQTQALAS